MPTEVTVASRVSRWKLGEYKTKYQHAHLREAQTDQTPVRFIFTLTGELFTVQKLCSCKTFREDALGNRGRS